MDNDSDIFSSLSTLPRVIDNVRDRILVSLCFADKPKESILGVKLLWKEGERDLHLRRPLKNTADRSSTCKSLLFSRQWHEEREEYRVKILFEDGARIFPINKSTIPRITHQSHLDTLQEDNNYVFTDDSRNIKVRICILDMRPEKLEPSLFNARLNEENCVGHLLCLCSHNESCNTVDRVRSNVLMAHAEHDTVLESRNILERTLGNTLKAISLSVDHLGDFVGSIFRRLTSIPHHLATTVKKIESAGQEFIDRIFKDIIAYLHGLLAKIEHKFLSNKESWIYPPPPVHISSDGKTWQNWGNSLRSNPLLIYSDDNGPMGSLTSVRELQNAIKAATKQGRLPIRVFGSNHSWAALVQTTGTLIDSRKFGWVSGSPKNADVFNQETVEKFMDYKYLYVTPQDPLANNHPTVTFPPGIATGTLERWIYDKPHDRNGQPLDQKYSLGTSTYEDVFTMGGIVAAACHGTGRNYPTVSDWLVAVEFIDAKSMLRRVEIDGKCFKRQSEDHDWEPWNFSKLKNVSGKDLFKVAICNYGLLGIMWSLTIRVIPGFSTLFIAKNIRWADYLDDTVQARKNLNDLQNRSSSLEFFYYPFASHNLVSWRKNPHVYMLRHLEDSPANRELLEAEGFKIVEKSEDYYLLRDAKTRFFAKIFFKIITNLLKGPTIISGIALPYILAQIPNNLEYTKDEAITLPHWRANHSVNAVGAVEKIHVLNIEWCVPMQFNQPSGDGLNHALRIHSHLIKSIHKAADHKEFPVTVVAEIRFFRGSGAYLAPVYDPNFSFPDDPFVNPEKPYGGWAAPEIVTGIHNPWWIAFYEKMNTHVYKMIKNEVPVRNHLAKQYGSIPKQFQKLRSEFDRREYKLKPFTKFAEIRREIDPDNVFLVPFMHQFLDTTDRQYNAPHDYPIREDGNFPELKV